MPLTWDATKVADYENLTDDETVTRESLIFAAVAVGINEITATNAEDFYKRVAFWEKVLGAYRYDGAGDPLYFTPDDVRRFVGLRTNASTMTVAKFRTHVWNAHERWNVPREV